MSQIHRVGAGIAAILRTERLDLKLNHRAVHIGSMKGRARIHVIKVTA